MTSKSPVRACDDIDVYILSSVLPESPFAKEDKLAWAHKRLQELKPENIIFAPYGQSKKDHVPGGILPDDTLLDDFTKNLLNWSQYAVGIKLLNNINHTHETWTGDLVRFDERPYKLAAQIATIMRRQRCA